MTLCQVHTVGSKIVYLTTIASFQILNQTTLDISPKFSPVYVNRTFTKKKTLLEFDWKFKNKSKVLKNIIKFYFPLYVIFMPLVWTKREYK